MTVLARKPQLSFVTAGIASLLYGALFLKSHDSAELLHSSIVIRFSLLWVIALFSSVVVQDLEAQDEFLSRITHELKAPLACIKTAAKLTLDEFNNNGKRMDESDQRRMLAIIERSTTKIVQMVDDTTDLFRLEMGKMVLRPSAFSTVNMINECAEEFRDTCRERGLNSRQNWNPPCP